MFWFTARLERSALTARPEARSRVRDLRRRRRALGDLAPPAPRPPPARRPGAAPALRGRVLVAEDNVVNQKVAARILERLGYEVDVAATGNEAVAAVGQHTYDAILMDGQMPQTDGFEATRVIRAMEGDAPHADHRADRERDAGGPRALPGRGHGRLRLEARGPRAARGRPPALGPRRAAPPRASRIARRSWAERSTGPVDWDVLSELLAMTKREFLQELVGIFLRDSRRMMAELRGAYERGDRAECKRIAHKLRGSCATIGARRMMKLTAEMEELGDEATAAPRRGACCADLEEEFAAVRGALLTEKRRAGAPFVVVEDAPD